MAQRQSPLNADTHDEAILTKHALPELTSLFATELGLSLSPDQPVGQVRHQLYRSLLLAELALKVSAAGGDVSKLTAISVPEATRQREQLLTLCQQWRNRLDMRESYAAWANQIQAEAQILGLGLHAATLTEVETFACVESLLLDWVEAQILDGAITDVLPLITRRKTSFWSLYVGEYQLGKYSATDDPYSIEAGLRLVNTTLANNFVRPDESNKAQSYVKEKGRYTLIDKVKVRYLSDDDKYWAELVNFGHRYVHVPDRYIRQYDLLLMGGSWAQIDIRHEYDDEARGKRSPFWIDDVKPIQVGSFDLDTYRSYRREFDSESKPLIF